MNNLKTMPKLVGNVVTLGNGISYTLHALALHLRGTGRRARLQFAAAQGYASRDTYPDLNTASRQVFRRETILRAKRIRSTRKRVGAIDPVSA